MTDERPPSEQGSERFAASMNLLTSLLARPLDPGYEAAARRRAAGDPPRRSALGSVLLGTIAVVLGALSVTAAVTLRAPQPAVVQARSVLEDEVRERSAEVERAELELATLDAEIQRLQSAALEASDPEMLAQLSADSAVSGAVALEGPGVRVTLADAAGAGDGDADRKVHDSDLRIVVNGLWAAGAEAVTVNGLRVTGLTAIRAAGQAVLVDLQPLVGPYVVEAIGDPDRLPTRFSSTPARDHLALLRAAYDIESSVESVSRVLAPGAPAPTLDNAGAVQVEDQEET